MRLRLPTFSSVARAMVCRASTVLPGAGNVSEDAEGGTVMHTYLERVRNLRAEGKPVEEAATIAITEAPEHERDFLDAIPLKNLGRLLDPDAYVAEVTFAFDARNGLGRELGVGLDRDYSAAKEYEFVGTLDGVGLLGVDAVAVHDWKRRGYAVKPPKENWQIRTGIVAACAAWGRVRGPGSIIRIRDDGRPYTDTYEFSAEQVVADARQLQRLAIRIKRDQEAHAKGEEIPAITGEHCKFCPSFQWCPSNLTLARRAALEPEALKTEFVALVTRENAPRVLQAVKQLKAVTAAIEEALDELATQYAKAGMPIDLGEGLVYGPSPKSTEHIDPDTAEAVVRELLGEHADAAIDTTITKSSIERGVRAKLQAEGRIRGVGAMKEEIMNRIRAQGAMRKSVSYNCKITSPQRIALPPPTKDKVT